MATTERFRIVGYDHHQWGSAAWLTDGGDLTRDPPRAAEFGSYIEAERRAAELFAAQHLGLLWMPVPGEVDDLAEIQSDHRKPWRDPSTT